MDKEEDEDFWVINKRLKVLRRGSYFLENICVRVLEAIGEFGIFWG